MSAETSLAPPPTLTLMGRRPSEWLVGLPTITLLLLVLVIGTGEMLHGQLLRMGEAMFGDSQNGVQYFMLRAEPEKPTCNAQLNIETEIARQINAGANSGTDAIDDLFGTTAVNPAALREEVIAMRDRLREAHACPPTEFDVKHSEGGMVDAEFAVQYIVLSQAAAHPELADNVGNIALLIRAEAVGLLPPGMGQAAANAYRELRRVQHRARLNEEPTDVPMALLASEREAVLALWRVVMG